MLFIFGEVSKLRKWRTFFILMLLYVIFDMSTESSVLASVREVGEKQRSAEPIEMTVILERLYVDGELSQETTKEMIWSLEEFWAKYDQWQLIEMKKDQMVFRVYIDDISPLLKTNGYFGITDEGVFTIFNGRPKQTNIIQSFFQIDLGKLESKKWEELKKGIPIKTKEQYVQVIETFKPYSKIDKQAK